MARSVRAVLVVVALTSSACTADFFLEQDTDASTSGMASTGGATTDPSASAGSAEGSSVDATTALPTTEGDTTTTTTVGAEGSDTTEGVTAETTGTETTETPETGVEALATETSVEEASTDPTGGEGGGGVLDCPDQAGARACDEVPACDWYGEAEACFADPCHPDAEIACNERVFDACNAAPLCTWLGDVEGGECAYAPCGKLDIEACMQSEACVWAEGEGVCMFVECPACFEVGELDCMEMEACTWLDAQEACVPD